MLVLPTLHTYLSQLLSPPYIHTALLLTPEGALVSYACQMGAESSSGGTQGHGSHSSPTISGAGVAPPSPDSIQPNGSTNSGTPRSSKPGSVDSVETRTGPAPPQRSKDEVRMVAGLGAEVWAETRDEGEGMVECELGRILVLAVDDEDGKTAGEGAEPLLLLAVNGTLEGDWDVMRVKAQKLAKFLAPSVNKHRSCMGTAGASTGSVKSRTRSAATSPGRGLKG